MRKFLIIITILAGIILFSTSSLEAQYKIFRSVMGNGGALISNTQNSLHCTLGQAVIGKATGTSNTGRFGFWYAVKIPTGVEEQPVTEGYELKQNFPNPFKNDTRISFTVPRDMHVILELIDLTGRTVKSLLNDRVEAGEHEIRFDAGMLTSGIYYYRLHGDNFTAAKMLTIIK